MMDGAEVVIIGGGIAGLYPAALLAARGKQVLVLEKDDVGFEQSGRSMAGIALPGNSTPDDGGSLVSASARAWDEFEERFGRSIELNREGWNSVVVDESDRSFSDLDRQMWRASAPDPSSETLGLEEARERFPSLQGPFLSMDVRAGGHVNRTLVLLALEEDSVRAGARTEIGVLVHGFEMAGDRVTAVKTSRGSVGCDSVLIAAGLWSSRLTDQLGLHIPLQRLRAPYGETGPMASGLVPGMLRAGSFGARQNADGTIRVGTGGYRESNVIHDLSVDDLRDLRTWSPALIKQRKDVRFGLDRGILRHDLARLRRGSSAIAPTGWEPTRNKRAPLARLDQLSKLVPALRDARLHRWAAGVVDITPDLEPVVGRLPDLSNAFVSTGFSGHGFILGPGAGEAVAALIALDDDRIDLAKYRPERFREGRVAMRESMF